jgi:hypothetical protein
MEQKFAPNRNKSVMTFETKFIAQKEQDATKPEQQLKIHRTKLLIVEQTTRTNIINLR